MRGINFQINDNELILKKKLKKNETYKINNRDKIYSLHIYQKPQWARGVTSMCEDNMHILMLDWDNICRWIVEKEIKELSRILMCPIYLFKTREEIKDTQIVGHYHAICLAKHYPFMVTNFQERTSCDANYRTMPLRNIYRSWVLRLSEKKGSSKPKFIRVIGDTRKVTVEISEPHLRLLESLYKLPKINYLKKDGLKIIYVNEYETRT